MAVAGLRSFLVTHTPELDMANIRTQHGGCYSPSKLFASGTGVYFRHSSRDIQMPTPQCTDAHSAPQSSEIPSGAIGPHKYFVDATRKATLQTTQTRKYAGE